MLIHYRRLTVADIGAILEKNSVLYSRRNHRIVNANKPDLIAIQVEKDLPAMNVSKLLFRFDVYNNLEAVQKEIIRAGFEQTGIGAKYSKTESLAVSNSDDATLLVNNILTILQQMLSQFPLHMYPSPVMKAIIDYQQFFCSSVPKIELSALLNDLGWPEYYLDGTLHKAMGASYFLSPYQHRYWSAWVAGDQIIPVFASELQAEAFLRARMDNVCQLRQIAIANLRCWQEECPPDLYVLSNPSSGSKQKITWLQNELEQLGHNQELCICNKY